ncbi:hypothetical protein N5F23_13945 [Pseudomonas sichuanensis]|uniref:hypothetical protein n=1 Tax=Pseudomonas sichuanensis TaxID=2213015 RepID=UPI002446D9EB|nr:hypothetical protein [Pseudomonas sichuanensis]MDH0730385.1 hypothetical protein [Pseudomonas sichuanensis]MDH1583684.1 hypothetical protein [Pseudomonas sichuanensis]MDH1594231.1 hypothetical protein [Pseudomonas sichuanensis]MDH1597856.1 hypothetical protein [Pseudomonas sichuanensis]
MSKPIATFKKRNRAEQVRQQINKPKFVQQLGIRMSVGAPEVPAIIDPSDGTLARQALDQDLMIKIPAWTFLPDDPAYGFETLQLQYSLTGVDSSFIDIGPLERLDAPILPEQFPFYMAFPQAKLPRDGRLWIRYRHVNYADQPSTSSSIALICDSTPPWGSSEPPQPELPPNPINETYLGQNPDGVEVTLPVYPAPQLGDLFQLYYLEKLPEDLGDFGQPAASGAIAPDRKTSIPTELIRRLGDGHHVVVYLLYDKASNRSRISLPAYLDVVLGEEPAALLPPEVPLARDDGIIDLKDAYLNVYLEIPEYQHHKGTDVIRATWGSKTLPDETVGTRPFPLVMRVDKDVLHAEFGNSPTPVSTRVSYSVRRGQAAYGPQATDIVVDFTIAGPPRPDPDPDWPDPINPALLSPSVRSASGQDNHLVKADNGQPAQLTFELYPGAQTGQVVDFYWGGRLVESARHTIDMSNSDPNRKVSIPWADIEAAGNHAAPGLEVYYTVRAAEDALNEQQSNPRLVIVEAIDMTPGIPTFEGISPNGWLNCDSLWEPGNDQPAFRVRIPACSHLKVQPGEQITLEWVAFDAIVAGNPIPDLGDPETITLDETMINEGFIWRIEPYATRIQPIFDVAPLAARGEVRYTIVHLPDPSPWARNKLSLSNNETGGHCLGPIRK